MAELSEGIRSCLVVPQAVLYSLVVALLLLPRTSEWTLRRIVYFDAVFVAGLWLNQAFQPLDFTMPRDVRISFSKTIAELFIFTMGWAITLATSPHPSAARVAATLAVAGLPVFFCAKIVAGVLAPPWTSLSIFNAVVRPSAFHCPCVTWISGFPRRRSVEGTLAPL